MLAAAATAAAAAADPLPWFPDIRRQGTKGREPHHACAKIFSVQRRARGRDTFANLKESILAQKNASFLSIFESWGPKFVKKGASGGLPQNTQNLDDFRMAFLTILAPKWDPKSTPKKKTGVIF